MKEIKATNIRTIDGASPELMFTRFSFNGKEFVSIKQVDETFCQECDGTHVLAWDEFKTLVMALNLTAGYELHDPHDGVYG